MNLRDAHLQFRTLFHTKDKLPVDGLLTVLRGAEGVAIDLFEFDDWLHKEHGNYEEDWGWSMQELITQKYGNEATNFIQKLI